MSIKLKDTIYDLINKATKDGSGNTITSTYLKLSGGNMTGGLSINTSSVNNPLLLDQTSSSTETYIKIQVKGEYKSAIGYTNTQGAYIYNKTAGKYLGINDSGNAHVSGTLVWTQSNLTKVSQLANDAGYITSMGSHTHSTYVLKAGDIMTGPLRFERPTSADNNYNEGARFNLGGGNNWAGFIIGASAGTSSGTQEGAYSFLVNNKTLQIRHQNNNFMTVNTSRDIQWNPGLFAIVTGQTECGIRFGELSNTASFVGRYGTYMSLFNANNPNSEIRIHDSNNEVTIGTYNQKNRFIVNGSGNAAGYYSQIYAVSPNEASLTLSNSSLQSDPNFYTVGMTHSDNLFWIWSGKVSGRILTGNGSGYINIPARLAVGTTSNPSYPLQVGGSGYFSDTLYINKSSTACALSLVHTSSSYPWCWQRFVSNNQEWHVGVCSDSTSGTNRLNAGAFEIRGRGQSDEGIFIRQESSSYGKLVVANNSNTETSIGYLNTNHSSTWPVWTVGCGIGTGVRTFGWWYQPNSSTGGGCRMYLDEGGNLFLGGTLFIGGQAITFTT